MTDVNTAVAEPSAAAAPVVKEFNPSDQHSWSPEQREHWNRTGDVPEAPKKQDSAPAQDKSDKAAEADAAKPSQEKPKHKDKTKLSAEERIAELESTIAKIREGAGIKTEAKAAAPQPAAPKLEEPKKPKLEEFDSFEKYEEAKDKYYVDMADYRAKKAVEEDRQARMMAEQRTKAESEMAEAAKVYPDFEEKSKPVMKTLLEDKSIHELFTLAVSTSDVFPHLVYALSNEQAQTLLETARKNPLLAIKQLGVLEAETRAQLAKPSKEPEAPKTPEPPKPRAPKPPAEVGGRGTAPDDETVQAARDGNFTAFQAAENRKKFSTAQR